jgi:hypothetical protein
MTFILAEDAAIKSLLAGITVTDEKVLTDPLKVVSKKSLTSNRITLTTRGAHGFVVGQNVTVSGIDPIFNGTYQIIAVPSTTTFKYAKTHANVASSAANGSATIGAFRNVQVWFGFPDVELRAQTYPYMTIDLIDVKPALERQSSGMMYDSDNRGTITPVQGITYRYSIPLPYDLVYQVTSYSRHPRHDRAIIHQLLQKKFPSQYGNLDVPNELGTETAKRHMFLDGFVKRDMIEDGRRLFRNVFTIRVVSEMTPMDADNALSAVQTVHINRITDEIPNGLTPVAYLTQGD